MKTVNETLWEETKAGEELDALYRDLETGEVFAVELKVEPEETFGKFTIRCATVARMDFECPRLLGFCKPEEVERMGIDVY